MTAAATPAGTGVPTSATTSRPIWQVGAVAGVAAASAAVAVAVAAKGVDVPLEVDGDEIPLAGFVFVTLFWSAVGTVVAYALARWAKRPARTFVVATVVLTVLSFGPVVMADATTATQVALALSHVAAAAIVIPVLGRRLAQRG